MLHKTHFFSLLILLLTLSACSTPKNIEPTSLSGSNLGEIREGEELAKRLLAHSKFSTNQHAISVINKVGEKLIKVVEKEYDTSHYHWEFFLLEDKWKANAFCLPGGKIFVFSGLFPYLDNEDEIALVLSHEMVHALAHHKRKREGGKSFSKVATFINNTASFLNPFSLAFVKQKDMDKNKVLVEQYLYLPYLQSQEYEADLRGLDIMQKAGYNPQAGLTFWSKFPKESRIRPEYISTHPSSQHRLEKIKALIKSK